MSQQFYWVGSQADGATQGNAAPTNLNSNDAAAVTGESTFISKENCWNNPDNWAVAYGGQEHRLFTVPSGHRFPVAGDRAEFKGSLYCDGDFPTVDGVTYCYLPRSECLYGGISTDGKWYGISSDFKTLLTHGGTNAAGLTAQAGALVTFNTDDTYSKALLHQTFNCDQESIGSSCPGVGGTFAGQENVPSSEWQEQWPHNGGNRARIGIMMDPTFSTGGISPIVGDWHGLSISTNGAGFAREKEHRINNTNCRTTLGGRTYIKHSQVNNGEYVEFLQSSDSAGCTLQNIYLNRGGITFDDWWDGESDTATNTMTFSTVVISPAGSSDQGGFLKFGITGSFFDTSDKIMSSNIIYSREPMRTVQIKCAERSGGPKNVRMGMVRVPYYFAADIGEIELNPQLLDTTIIGDNVTGLDEVPNTCAWFGPKYSGNLYNWWPTGFSCGELNMTEEYNGRVGTRLNNSVIIAPTMAGSTADAYINYLSIRSGWLIPYAKNISNDVKLRVQAGEIANPAVLQTYDRGRDWEGFEISGQTVLAGVTYGVTGSGLLTLSGQPDIRFNAGTRISCISGVSGDGATVDNFGFNVEKQDR